MKSELIVELRASLPSAWPGLSTIFLRLYVARLPLLDEGLASADFGRWNKI